MSLGTITKEFLYDTNVIVQQIPREEKYYYSTLRHINKVIFSVVVLRTLASLYFSLVFWFQKSKETKNIEARKVNYLKGIWRFYNQIMIGYLTNLSIFLEIRLQYRLAWIHGIHHKVHYIVHRMFLLVELIQMFGLVDLVYNRF